MPTDRLASLSELKNGAPTIDQRESEVRQMKSVLCQTCGCSLVRLQITRKEATHLAYDGADYYFCCTGCAELFRSDPKYYIAQIRDVVLCPGCLGEKLLA